MNRYAPIALLSGALLLVVPGCGQDVGPATLLDDLLSATPVIGDMRDSPGYRRNEMPRPPVEGTVPIASPSGDSPPPFDVGELATVAAALENPLPATEEVLFRGERVYQIHCAVCHADDGTGRGPVVAPDRFPVERTVVGPAAVELTDGYLYGVVRIGRGFMPAYGSRITHEDRWAVVHYVRELQRRANGEPATVDPGLPVETELDPEAVQDTEPSPVQDPMVEDADDEAPVVDVLPDDADDS